MGDKGLYINNAMITDSINFAKVKGRLKMSRTSVSPKFVPKMTLYISSIGPEVGEISTKP